MRIFALSNFVSSFISFGHPFQISAVMLTNLALENLLMPPFSKIVWFFDPANWRKQKLYGEQTCFCSKMKGIKPLWFPQRTCQYFPSPKSVFHCGYSTLSSCCYNLQLYVCGWIFACYWKNNLFKVIKLDLRVLQVFIFFSNFCLFSFEILRWNHTRSH